MTRRMQKAFDEASKLNGSEQDAIAAVLLQEIQPERRRDAKFARAESHRLLSRLADEALDAPRGGDLR